MYNSNRKHEPGGVVRVSIESGQGNHRAGEGVAKGIDLHPYDPLIPCLPVDRDRQVFMGWQAGTPPSGGCVGATGWSPLLLRHPPGKRGLASASGLRSKSQARASSRPYGGPPRLRLSLGTRQLLVVGFHRQCSSFPESYKIERITRIYRILIYCWSPVKTMNFSPKALVFFGYGTEEARDTCRLRSEGSSGTDHEVSL